ncbi:hypothetical protein SAMD00019534_010900 [Acytostelium subglobosum LB1]|uniref:hypothetical protein n=1 Tax=Acytostelium subglobosum LB1 TaxID=1410327 RepID=UPI0006448F41|nr:hypothetical protein SAMD00019534_010900 [Acytostelium subglobosum LB1]GAM17915.1 hypothetical protein SAMD00019534_010900 [Acytostelium subglobosum LB1]|eukprot:XP_012758511.1 hypothetical protein SAMD00019534_010900 [Acytostelium subglobosum LB1]
MRVTADPDGLGLASVPFPKSSLLKLELSDSFNHMILPSSLPDSITVLTLGFYYNQPINVNTLPKSLNTLTFGQKYRFNSIIAPDSLPHTLIQLKFGKIFSKLTDKLLSSLPMLNSLSFGFGIVGPLTPGSLPPSLQTLDIERSPRLIVDDPQSIPPALTKLSVFAQSQVSPFPLHLLSLRIYEIDDITLVPGSLPSSLTELIIVSRIKIVLSPGSLPQSLQSLILSGRMDQELAQGTLPPSLTLLCLPDNCTLNIVDTIPLGLRSLSIAGVHLVKYFEQLTHLEHVELKLPCDLDDTNISTLKCNRLKFTVKSIYVDCDPSMDFTFATRTTTPDELLAVITRAIRAFPNVDTFEVVQELHSTHLIRAIDNNQFLHLHSNHSFKLITLSS